MKAGRIWLSLLAMFAFTAGLHTTGATIPLGRPAHPLATPTLALIPQRNPNPPRQTVDVDVTVGGVLDLGAFQLDVIYDSDFLRLEGVSVTSFLGQLVDCEPNLERCTVPLGPMLPVGRARFGVATFGAPAGPSGEGVVAVLHLQPVGRTGSTVLMIENAVLSDTHAVPTVPETHGATLILRHLLYLPLSRRD